MHALAMTAGLSSVIAVPVIADTEQSLCAARRETTHSLPAC